MAIHVLILRKCMKTTPYRMPLHECIGFCPMDLLKISPLMAPQNRPIFIYRLVILIFKIEMTDQLSFCLITQSSDMLFPNLLQCLMIVQIRHLSNSSGLGRKSHIHVYEMLHFKLSIDFSQLKE